MSTMPPPSLPALPRRMRRAAGDVGVQRTNDDAQATKLSCASLGYFKDELLPLLAKCLPSRKPPLINRGTWARYAVMRQITTDFVEACVQQHQQQSHQQQGVSDDSAGAAQQQQQQQYAEPQAARPCCIAPGTSGPQVSDSSSISSSSSSSVVFTQPVCQIVVLGAGSDSSWFNLQQQQWPLLPGVRYIELDYHEVVSKKARIILSTSTLLQLLPDGTTASTTPAAAAAAAPQDATAAYAAWTKQAGAPAAQPAAEPGGSAAPEAAAARQDPGLEQYPLKAEQQQQQQPQAPCAVGTHAATAAELPPAAAAAAAAEPNSSSSSCCCSRCSGPVPPAAVVGHVQELCGPRYSLVGVDLRNMQQLQAALARADFDPGLPTLYLSECVLIYLEPVEAERLLAFAAATARAAGSSAAVAVYEQTRPDDAFGSTMISNLEARGCPLRSVMAVPTPASQEQRLLATGWDAAAAADMAAVYYNGSTISSNSNNNGSTGLPVAAGKLMPGQPGSSSSGPVGSFTGLNAAAASAAASAAAGSSGGWLRPHWVAARSRIERLELLDELEEWRLLQEHYCLVLGVVGDGPSGWLAKGLQLEQLSALTARQ